MAESDVEYRWVEGPSFFRTSEYVLDERRLMFTHAARDELRALLPDDVELVKEEEQERDYEYLDELDNGIDYEPQ